MSEKKCPHCEGRTTCKKRCCDGDTFNQKICTVCGGTGTSYDKKEKSCPHCNGGTVCSKSCCGGSNFYPKICTVCRGSGTG